MVKTTLTKRKKQYYTFQIKSELLLRVMLKCLHLSMEPEEIKQEVLKLVFPVRSLKQFTKVENEQTIKIPVFSVELVTIEKLGKFST